MSTNRASLMHQKRKRHSTSSDDKLQDLTTTSKTSLETDVVLNSKEPLEQEDLPQISSHRYNGMKTCNFDLPLQEDCFAPEENLEPKSAGLKSSRTRRVWHKSLEKTHSCQIKERSLLGHIMCSEEAQKRF